jgi:rod shape-determining protein MreC
LLVVLILAVVLMVVDTFTELTEPFHALEDRILRSVQVFSNLPTRIWEWDIVDLISKEELVQENSRLRNERLINLGQLQRMAELSAENLRLRQLLNATELLMDSVLVTEVIGVSPNPQSHRVTIDRGHADGIYLGQPILDAEGLMGQVIDIYQNHSVALLITDSSHALPVQVLRNGVRSIAEGTSDYNRLQLRYVSPTADIREGDKLVSSGLGGRFPVGYPVGTVTEISQKPGDTFRRVTVDPAAELDRSRHLLLVFTLDDGSLLKEQP